MSPVDSADESVPVMVCAAVLVMKSAALPPVSALMPTPETVCVVAKLLSSTLTTLPTTEMLVAETATRSVKLSVVVLAVDERLSCG